MDKFNFKAVYLIDNIKFIIRYTKKRLPIKKGILF
jgi:hypothetical protein